MTRRVPLVLLLLLLASSDAVSGDTESVRPVVLVLLGGGVTAEEMVDEARMPWLAAQDGVRVTLDAEGTRPHAGAIEILTGRPDDRVGGGHPRPEHPTVMERLRRARNLPPEAVWFVSYDGGDALNLAWSDDPAYGRSAAPSVCEARGAFAAPLAPLLETLGRPVPTQDETWTLLGHLRRLGHETLGARRPESVDAASADSERIERALLAEIDRRTVLVQGRDAKAMGAARTLLAVHRPVLTVIRLGDLTLAREEERRRPSLAGEDAILATLQRAMGDRARLLVVGEPYHPGGEAAKGRSRVGLVALGGDLRREGRGRGRLKDVAATVLALLGGLDDAPGTPTVLLRPRGRR